VKSLFCFFFRIFIITQSFAQQGEPIPFDWSGQNGMSTYRGFLLWNNDWTSNELFFDGTFQSYPLRFGEAIAQDSYLSNSDILLNFFFSDSTEVKTSFDYRQGDYLFDQINVNAVYKKMNRDVELNGFKRSYGGPFSQFIQPENQGTTVVTPNQQSYFFRYLIGESNNTSALSIGRFITNSGLYNPSDQNGKHVDEITTASFSIQNQWNKYDFRLRISQYLESRKWMTNLFSESLHYLNRGQVVGYFTPADKGDRFWELWFSGNTQALTYQDTSISKRRSWISILGNMDKDLFHIQGGIDAGNGSILPCFSVSMNRKINSINWITKLELKNNPQHIIVWNSSRSFFEKWITGGSELDWELDNIFLFASVNVWHVNNLMINELDSTMTSRDLYSLKTGFDWDIPIGVKLSGVWTHSSKETLLSDGIGDHIKTKLKYTRPLFSNKMVLTAELAVDALLDRDTSFVYYPGLQRPQYSNQIVRYLINYTDEIGEDHQKIWPSFLKDYFTAHILISAKVSSLTVSYRMQNVFNTHEEMFSKLISDFPDAWVSPNNNGYFDQMKRLVSFEVEWEFKD